MEGQNRDATGSRKAFLLRSLEWSKKEGGEEGKKKKCRRNVKSAGG